MTFEAFLRRGVGSEASKSTLWNFSTDAGILDSAKQQPTAGRKFCE
jgi:hypothetical protein